MKDIPFEDEIRALCDEAARSDSLPALADVMINYCARIAAGFAVREADLEPILTEISRLFHKEYHEFVKFSKKRGVNPWTSH